MIRSNSEFFEDSGGRIHVIYREHLEPEDEYQASTYKHWIKGMGGRWESSTIELS